MHHPRVFSLGSILIAGMLLVSACGSPTPLAQPTQMPTMAIGDMPDFVQTAATTVQETYQFAVTNPHALETVPCYCGCNNLGHKSNLDCYITNTSSAGKITFDSHAVYCGVCSDITHDVMRLQKAGYSPHEIRSYVDGQYSSFGPSTDTAMPVE